MRNNKNVDIEQCEIGTKLKVGIPTYWAHWAKDRHKKLSWFKAKLVEKHEHSFVLNVYPMDFIGRMMFLKDDDYRIVKTLK